MDGLYTKNTTTLEVEMIVNASKDLEFRSVNLLLYYSIRLTDDDKTDGKEFYGTLQILEKREGPSKTKLSANCDPSGIGQR
jgi:hypothetical protein